MANSSSTEGGSKPEGADRQDENDFFDPDRESAELSERIQQSLREMAGLNPDGSFPSEEAAERPHEAPNDTSAARPAEGTPPGRDEDGPPHP